VHGSNAGDNAGADVQAGPPKLPCQLFGGGEPSGLALAQTYQSAFGLSDEVLASRNQGCWFEV